jgi:Glycosyl hydrolases family 35
MASARSNEPWGERRLLISKGPPHLNGQDSVASYHRERVFWHGATAVAGILLATLLVGGVLPFFLFPMNKSSFPLPDRYDYLKPEEEPRCGDRPCFLPERIQVRRDKEGFPSFWNYEGPMRITYDGRSIMINGDRALFLSGSMHPARATRATWELALDEAVRNGLNMVTIYIFWGAHQPFPDSRIDWTLSGSGVSCEYGVTSCRWDLAQALRAAANRGLFVHIRVGPYVCAEYTNGGIPIWLPLKYPKMRMRRLNRDWLDNMEIFVRSTIAYLTANHLWAYQGGPIVMAQIENELVGDEDVSLEYLMKVSAEGIPVSEPSNGRRSSTLRNATIQDYANWCGDLAATLAPKVLWTMCNGLSAKNTVSTFNGDSFGASWLEHHGDSGRIQIDQPAMWTEDEGKFSRFTCACRFLTQPLTIQLMQVAFRYGATTQHARPTTFGVEQRDPWRRMHCSGLQEAVRI